VGFVIFCALLVLLALLAFGVAIFAPKKITVKDYGRETEETSPVPLIAGGVGVVLLILAALVFVPSGINDVPSRSVGVPVTFGKAGSPLPSGFHWEMPWTSVANISEAVQTDNYNQDRNIASYTGPAITVRLGGAQEGQADVSISYQVRGTAAPQLYLDYGSGGNVMNQIQSNLVYRTIRDALNNTLQNYNPITDALQSQSSGTSQFSQFDPQVLAQLNKNIGKYVNIVSFDVNYIHYSSSTQSYLEAIQQQSAKTQIAEEQIKTNTATAEANQALVSKTGTLTSSQLQQECLSIVQQAEKDNYQLPALFGNCVTSTSGSAIVSAGK
jgi:hypothetical protein